MPPHKRSNVNQREVGVDTGSYEDALKHTLRLAPDVILIGEIRDRETIEHALAFADTGLWPSPPCMPTTPTSRTGCPIRIQGKSFSRSSSGR